MDTKQRIELTDTVQGSIIKMAEGNPGAITVLARIVKEGPAIDPLSFDGGLGAILSLDNLGIYGSRIWMLYKDVCGQDLVSMLAVLRANQLGYLSERILNYAIENRGDGIDVSEITDQIKNRLSGFGKTK